MENEIQSTQEVTPPVLSPTKSKKTLLLVLLGLILVTISVYVGIQIGKRQVPNKQNVTVQPTTEPTQAVVDSTAQPTTNPTTNPTEDWKTYKSTSFNFSFKYPSELTYIYDQSDQYVENRISNAMILIQNFDGSKPRTETDNDFQIVVYIANKSGQFNLEDPQGEQTKTTINGIEVIKSFTTQKWVLVPTVFFQSSPNKVAFQLSNPKSTNEAWFDQIISTFQITN
jgi:hypothetical protein